MHRSQNVLKILFIGLLAGMGCGEREGDEPGECTDRADNDGDGFFDCDDEDCVFSPDCDDDDDDDDGGGGGGEDPPDPRLLELNGVDLTYSMSIVFDLPVFGVDNCIMEYSGAGASRFDAAGTRVTFDGTWRKTGGTCPTELDEVIWVGESGDAYHSFVFADDLLRLEEWHAHERDDAYTADDASKPHWFMTEMGETYDHGTPTVSHQFSEKVGQISATLNHDVTITFTK